MLILPVVNKRRIMNIRVGLKDASKVRERVSYDDALQSDIIVNREKFSDSSFKESRKEKAPMDFIRSRSMLHPRKYFVTTREENDSSLYDVYEVAPPPKKVNDSLDSLYGKAITDMRKEIPGVQNRGRYISFEKLGIGNHLTDDKIAKLQKIVSEVRDENEWPRLFEEAGIADLRDTVDFINHFDCTVLSDTTISEDSLQDALKAFSSINTRDSRNLSNYYEMAKSNSDIYAKLSYISKIVNGRPLALNRATTSDAKKLVKKKDEVEI